MINTNTAVGSKSGKNSTINKFMCKYKWMPNIHIQKDKINIFQPKISTPPQVVPFKIFATIRLFPQHNASLRCFITPL